MPPADPYIGAIVASSVPYRGVAQALMRSLFHCLSLWEYDNKPATRRWLIGFLRVLVAPASCSLLSSVFRCFVVASYQCYLHPSEKLDKSTSDVCQWQMISLRFRDNSVRRCLGVVVKRLLMTSTVYELALELTQCQSECWALNGITQLMKWNVKKCASGIIWLPTTNCKATFTRAYMYRVHVWYTRKQYMYARIDAVY